MANRPIFNIVHKEKTDEEGRKLSMGVWCSRTREEGRIYPGMLKSGPWNFYVNNKYADPDDVEAFGQHLIQVAEEMRGGSSEEPEW